MVHALQQAHQLLRPNGWLINVHDLPVPHLIELDDTETVHKVGWVLDKENFENTRAALNALTQVVADGLFDLADERNFIYNLYADSLKELQEYLAEWWESALLPDRTIQRLEALMQNSGESARITIALQARMSKLRPL